MFPARLSEHFTLAELTQTSAGLPNVPPMAFTANAFKLAAKLEQAREILGGPLVINSAYRSEDVNRAAGSVSRTSAHLFFLGADIRPWEGMPVERIFEVLSEHPTFMRDVDQLIIERGCVHLGLPTPIHQGRARRELRKEIIHPGNVREYPLLRVWEVPA